MPIVPNERPIGSLTLAETKNNQRFEVEMNGAIRWIQGQVRLNLTNGNPAPTWVKDDILNGITHLELVLNGKPIKIDTDGLLQYLKEEIMKGEEPYKIAPSSTNNVADYICGWDFVFDFARFVLVDNDVSALLQTKNLSNLEIVVATDFTKAASANHATFNSGKIDFFIRDYSGSVDGKDINDDTEITMTNIIEGYEGIALETNKKQFDADAQEIALKSGSGILQHILVVKNNGVRDSGLVTDVKYARSKGQRVNFLERSFNSIRAKNKTEYGLDAILDGTIYIDWVEKLGSNTGFVTGARNDEVLRLLTTSDVVKAQDKIFVVTRYI